MNIKQVNRHWVIDQLDKYNMTIKDLARELGLNYKTLITTLSENGRGGIKRESVKSRFFYYFEFLRLKSELEKVSKG